MTILKAWMAGAGPNDAKNAARFLDRGGAQRVRRVPGRGFEITLPFRGDAYRVVYAVQLAGEIWVIHAFQKKSTQATKTPKREDRSGQRSSKEAEVDEIGRASCRERV